MTQNWLGKRKRLLGKRATVGYARPDYKKVPLWACVSFQAHGVQAIVTFKKGSKVYDPPVIDDQ